MNRIQRTLRTVCCALATGAITILLAAAEVVAASRSLTAAAVTIPRGSSGEVRISLVSQGNENAVGFSVTFDPALLAYSSAAAGTGASGASLNVNDSQKHNGKVGVILALPAGQTLVPGSLELVRLAFAASAGSQTQTTAIAFGDTPVFREISDSQANVLDAVYEGAFVTLQGAAGSCTGPYDLIIPAAAHSNNQWQSDVDILNDGTGDAAVDIALLKQNQANASPLVHSIHIPPDQAARIVDILGAVLPATNAALGVRFCQGTPAVNSRFYNTAGPNGGTFGMWVPGLPASAAITPGTRGTFHLLSYSTASASGFRVNIGLANAQSSTAVAVIRLYGDDGAQIGQSITKTLRAFEQFQYTRLHQLVNSPSVAHGWATVEVTTPGARVHAYAMLIDNASNDPAFMPAELR